MGCVGTKPEDPAPEVHDDKTAGQDDDDSEKAKRQRRRLSVAPQHVGDISKNVKLAAEEKSGDTDTDGLTEIERKAVGSCRIASKSKKGVVPYNKNKVNQDRPVIKWAVGDDPSVSLFGVMDGHGEFGHLVAQFVQDNLPVYLAAEKNLKEDPEKYITLAVKKMCDKLAETNINIAFSGTTAVFGVKIDQKLYVGNIGDSRCVVCRQTANGEIESIALSIDQKPDNPKEKARILKAGGRVEPLPGPPGEDTGPPRVWLAEVDVPGLAMSRSIGDEVSQTVGVICVPEIVEHDLAKEDLFAIWASDGVWEFMENKDAIALVHKHRDNLDDAATRLVEEACRRWRQEEEVIDDITVVVLQFS